MKAQGLTKETVLDIETGGRGFPPFRSGDAIRVAERIKEGSKERIQYFEGDVIAMNNNGISSTFTIRRIGANGVAVEKIFPYYSPKIEGITFVREGDVRRAKLFYMRDRIGKKARVPEKARTADQKRKLEKRLNPIESPVVVESKIDESVQEVAPAVEKVVAPTENPTVEEKVKAPIEEVQKEEAISTQDTQPETAQKEPQVSDADATEEDK